MVDFTFQEIATGGNLEISSSHLEEIENSSRFVKFKFGTDQVIALDSTAEYKDSSGNVILDGKIKVAKELVKDVNGDDRIYEIQLFDNGYDLIDDNLNEVFRNKQVEEIIEDIVVGVGLTFSNLLPAASGITIPKKVYRDRKPIEAINELCNTLSANWRVTGSTFVLYQKGLTVGSEVIDGNAEWNNPKGWKDDTDKKALTVIINGAPISQRTEETVTGTGTEFFIERIPLDMEVDGLVQTTDTIDGDYVVDAQDKKITFDSSQTDPVFKYSYLSKVRAQVGTGAKPIETLNKTYIETFSEARQLGRRYLDLFSDGIQSAVWMNTDLYGLDIRNIRVGDSIPVINRNNPTRDKNYLITKVVRKYPKQTEITVGEDEDAIYNWQAESVDRIKQLEADDNNLDFTQMDVYQTGTLTPTFAAELTHLFGVINDGAVLWASDTTLATDADLISDTGPDIDYAIAYDDDGLPSANVIDYLS